MLVYWLDLAPYNTALYVGWKVVKPNRGKYREQRVTVDNLEALPVSARVYLSGQRWRRA